MLVLTALAYFLLSKRRKTPGHKEAHPEAGQYVDPSATMAAPTIAGDTEQTYTFHEAQREQHCSLLGHMKSILKGGKDRSLTPAASLQPEVPPAPRKQVHFQEKVVQIIPSVSESLDDAESETEETTSDTAPILTPPDTPVVLTPLSPTGLFWGLTSNKDKAGTPVLVFLPEIWAADGLCAMGSAATMTRVWQPPLHILWPWQVRRKFPRPTPQLPRRMRGRVCITYAPVWRGGQFTHSARVACTKQTCTWWWSLWWSEAL